MPDQRMVVPPTVLHSQTGVPIRLSFQPGMLTLSSRAPSEGEATIDLPIDYTGTGLEIGFNPQLELVEGIEVQRIPKTRVESSTLHWRFARITRVVEEATRGFDLIHVHHWSSLSGDLVRRLSRSTPVA